MFFSTADMASQNVGANVPSHHDKSPFHTDELAAINSKSVAEGEFFPSVRLRDGTAVRTGTVATMLLNIKRYNSGERGEVERELELAIPTLHKVGLFELFTTDEWKSGTNAGRSLVGALAEKYIESQHTD